MDKTKFLAFLATIPGFGYKYLYIKMCTIKAKYRKMGKVILINNGDFDTFLESGNSECIIK